jgi:hypothetical protein
MTPSLSVEVLQNSVLSAKLGGMQIFTSEFLGKRVQVRFPIARKGPYQMRRQRRMNHDPRNWATRGKGEYFIINGRDLWCHPDDLSQLKEQLR